MVVKEFFQRIHSTADRLRQRANSQSLLIKEQFRYFKLRKILNKLGLRVRYKHHYTFQTSIDIPWMYLQEALNRNVTHKGFVFRIKNRSPGACVLETRGSFRNLISWPSGFVLHQISRLETKVQTGTRWLLSDALSERKQKPIWVTKEYLATRRGGLQKMELILSKSPREYSQAIPESPFLSRENRIRRMVWIPLLFDKASLTQQLPVPFICPEKAEGGILTYFERESSIVGDDIFRFEVWANVGLTTDDRSLQGWTKLFGAPNSSWAAESSMRKAGIVFDLFPKYLEEEFYRFAVFPARNFGKGDEFPPVFEENYLFENRSGTIHIFQKEMNFAVNRMVLFGIERHEKPIQFLKEHLGLEAKIHLPAYFISRVDTSIKSFDVIGIEHCVARETPASTQI